MEKSFVISIYAHFSYFSIKILTKHLRLVRKSILGKMLSRTMIVSYMSPEHTPTGNIVKKQAQTGDIVK